MRDANRKGLELVGPNSGNLYHGVDRHHGSYYDGMLQQHRNLLRCAGKYPQKPIIRVSTPPNLETS